MKFNDCAPFVRFAYPICLNHKHPAVARDNRLFYVKSGKGIMVIDQVEYAFSPGTVFLWQAGSEYYVSTPEAPNLISINFDYTNEFSHIQLPLTVLKSSDADYKKIKENQISFEDCPALNSPIVCQGSSGIHNLIDKILFECASRQPYYNERVSALFKELLVLIVRAVSMPNDARSDSALETILEHIHKNYASDIDNTTLAKLVGYHPYYLNKLFLSTNGVTLHKYVINYRIAISEQLLLSTNLSVEEIALKVGFTSSLSFSSSFKKKNGLTPTDFRKKIGASF